MIVLSIIIPCYNEADNLEALIKRCVELLDTNQETEIILVNNGSVDNSASVMAELLSKMKYKNLSVFHVPINKGYGYGILQGLDNAQGEFLCWTHADLQTDIFDCIKAYELMLTSRNCTVIKGKRKGRNFFDIVFTRLMQWYVLYKLGINLSDINGQPKLFTKKFYEETFRQNAPLDFSLDLYLLIKAKKIGKIIDFPVYFLPRVAGEAKGGSGNFNLKLKLLKRTMGFIQKMATDKK